MFPLLLSLFTLYAIALSAALARGYAVAAFMLDQLESGAHLGAAPGLAW